MRALLYAFVFLLGCTEPSGELADTSKSPAMQPATSASTPIAGEPADAMALRAALVRDISGHIDDRRVLDAMGRVPRHLFVPDVSMSWAYSDEPAPIGYGQTISQPTVVGLMTQALELSGRERVLEIGTGSGYQAAVLSVLAADVYTIEIVPQLAAESKERLAQLGYANVHVLAGDGYLGWPEHAPFDRIILTAAPEEVPQALLDQLADGGVLVAPVGPYHAIQRLVRYRKSRGKVSQEVLDLVQFVPMVRGRPR